MLHQIRIRGVERGIDAPEGDSILQCGLRAGLNLPYNCERGSCGECRARLLSGSVRQLLHTDYTFSASDKSRGWLLTCAHTAVSDLELEVEAFGTVESLPLQSLQARVRHIDRPRSDRLVLQLRSARSTALRFIAGQQVEIELPGIGQRRLYLANCPCDASRPSLHLRRFADDPFSDFMFEHLKVGENLQLHGPYGRFVLPARHLGALLFICWETGFAAVQSLLEQAMAQGLNGPVWLYWLTADPGGRYLENYCRALVDADESILYQGLDLGQAECMVDVLAPALPQADLSGAHALCVLPPEQSAAVAELLRQRGLSSQRTLIAAKPYL